MKSCFPAIGVAIIALISVVSCSRNSQDSPATIAKSECQKITGKALQLGSRVVKLELYNGTEWNVTDVDVVLRRPYTNLNLLPNETREEFQTRLVLGEQRRFRFEPSVTYDTERKSEPTKANLFLKPFSSGDFEGRIGDFLETAETNANWSWDIFSARGFKE